ncbi:MAG: hypothetical protein PWR27_1290 [Petroclostridium sp.]|jgi:hypothetical protein|nr:hypothetical protein [Petroclostridium sp.]
MGTVPQSHEKRMRQTNRPHVAQTNCPQAASILPAKHDFFSDFGWFPCYAMKYAMIGIVKTDSNVEINTDWAPR